MHWIIIGVKPAYYFKLLWSMWCPKILFSRMLCMGLARTKKSMALFHIWFSPSLFTFLLKASTCGSHPDCLVGQVKWVNRCDPLSTLFCNKFYSYNTTTFHGKCYQIFIDVNTCSTEPVCTWDQRCMQYKLQIKIMK